MDIRVITICFAIMVFLVIIIICFVLPEQNQVKTMSNLQIQEKQGQIIRQPAVTGQFYPADKDELEKIIEEFLESVPSSQNSASPLIGANSRINESGVNRGIPKILIVPHAGYVFSGQIAAYGFKELPGRNYERVILLGNSHQEYFEGLVLDDSDSWQTSLGQLEIDKELISQLTSENNKNNKIKINRQIHSAEHSLEVELPFLQKVLGNNFRLVPGLFGSNDNLTDLKSIVQSLLKVINDKTLVVISTDLSHYPAYENANEVDRKTIQAILSKEVENFLRQRNELESAGYENLFTAACGWPALVVAIELAREMELEGQLLNYANSGDIAEYGDKSQVVGYASVVFFAPQGVFSEGSAGEDTSGNPGETSDKREYVMLNNNEQQVALRLARNSLIRAFDKYAPKYNEYKNYKIFSEKRSVFVTLKKNGKLRGCIGLIEPPVIFLSEAIQQMALAAAFEDNRFLPLNQAELNEIKIELSVLTLPRKVSGVEEIELGRHGVIIKQGFNQGIFLPQVAEETGWNKEKFLSELCSQKAGLAQNCWQDPSVELYIFEAQVFGE